MSRIELTDNMMSATMKMAEGNPGAITAIMEIIKEGDLIDPQSAMGGGLGALLSMDTWEIYGSSIYVLWNDKCGRDTRKMLMIMRAAQLGLFSLAMLKEMAADQTRSVDIPEEEWESLDKSVCERLEHFARPKAVTG